MAKDQQSGSGNGTNRVVKSDKASTVKVTTETVRLLERSGSSESAKIAREYVER